MTSAELNLIPPDKAFISSDNILITRLSTYETTSLSFTHNYLYSVAADLGYYADRAFLPPEKDLEVWKEYELPGFLGVQSKRAGTDFDLIAVILSVVQEVGNLKWFLETTGFPLSRMERMSMPNLPLIIVGGASSAHTTILFGSESLADGIFTGEDTQEIRQLYQMVIEKRKQGLSKHQILQDLESIPGFIIPGKFKPVQKNFSSKPLEEKLLAFMPVNYGEGNPGKALIPISQGCRGFCSFCAESWARKPYQEFSSQELLSKLELLKVGAGAWKIDFFSFNFNMHRDFYPMLQGVWEYFEQIGLKSQRFDSIAEDPYLVQVEKLLGKTWFTCGLEGVSARLRKYLNKNLEESVLRKSMGYLAKAGIRELKIFLILTGQETEEDWDEFSSFCQWIRALPTPSGYPLKVVFSATPLVKFPFTPLEYEAYGNIKMLEKAMHRLSSCAKLTGFEARQAAGLSEIWVSERLLRPLDIQVFYQTWLECLKTDQFLYYDEIPGWFYRHWQLLLDEKGWTEEASQIAFEQESFKSPWDFLELGIHHAYLKHQGKRNKTYQEIQPKGLVQKNLENSGRNFFEFLQKNKKEKKYKTITLRTFLNSLAVDAGRAMTGAALAQSLMRADASFIKVFKGIKGCFWTEDLDRHCPVEGLEDWQLLVDDSWNWGEKDIFNLASDFFLPYGKVIGLATTPISKELSIETPYILDAQQYLLKNGLKHTYVKIGEGKYEYQFVPQSLKKQIVQSLTSEKKDDYWIYHLQFGLKGDWETLYRQGFIYPLKKPDHKIKFCCIK